MIRFLVAHFLLLTVAPALAQETPAEERSYLIGYVEGKLSTPNRQIRLNNIQGVLSSNATIGEITIDPTNPEVVWVGTGENVSGRHVGWGDGVYRSRDAGRSWQRMGLAASQHIGRILVDPRDGNVVLAAAEGPLWSAGGDRGVYRSGDGGATWTQALAIDDNTGVTDLEFDPSNPDVVYAAAYQRRRHVWGFLGGGPKSGIW